MSAVCQHEWTPHWFTISARIVRGGKQTYAVGHAQVHRCLRCERFIVDEQMIAQQLFQADEGGVSEVLVRLVGDAGMP